MKARRGSMLTLAAVWFGYGRRPEAVERIGSPCLMRMTFLAVRSDDLDRPSANSAAEQRASPASQAAINPSVVSASCHAISLRANW
jgi:hypothetical protein